MNKNGYDMFYKDWVKAGYYEIIRGDNWVRKYENTEVVSMESNRTGDSSLVVYGLVGLVNTGACGFVWY